MDMTNSKTIELLERVEGVEKGLQSEKRRHWKHMALFLGIVSLVMVSLIAVSLVFIDSSLVNNLQNANASNTKNVDYLQFVVPILLTVGGFFVAFLGVNRLKDIDALIEKTRDNLQQELSGEKAQLNELRGELFGSIQFEKKELQQHRQDLAETIDQKISVKTSNFTDSIRAELQVNQNELLGGLRDFAATQMQEIKTVSERISGELENFTELYGWLISSNKQSITTILESISTVYDAHQRVETLYASDPRPQNVAEIAIHIVNEVVECRIRGDENDYHNLAAELARQNLYWESCRVCETGIRYFGNDIDLLSDWISYGTKIGNYDDVEKALDKLTGIPKNLWNWRAFDYTVDYYLAIGNIEKADNFATEFIEWLPNEERAYHCQADVYQLKYRKSEGVERVISVLQKPLDMNLNCPMCAKKLADILSDNGRLNEALVAANRAIKELAQEQPSVNFAYVFNRRALIFDRLFYQSMLASSDKAIDGETLQYAISAYDDYKVAIESRRLSYVTTTQAQTRKKLIEKYVPDEVKENGQDASTVSYETLMRLLESQKGLSSHN